MMDTDELPRDPLADIDLSLMPDMPVPNTNDLPILDKAWHILHMARWSPLAKTLSTEVIGMSMDQLKLLLGPLWREVYPDKDPLEQEPLLPAAIFLVDAAINKIGTQLSQRPEEERTKAKEEAREALESAPKRFRQL